MSTLHLHIGELQRVTAQPEDGLVGLGLLQDRVSEVKRLAEGWKRSLQVFARLRRREENRPMLEVLRDAPA